MNGSAKSIDSVSKPWFTPLTDSGDFVLDDNQVE